MLGFPYLLYEVWLFIKPALTDIERKSASRFVVYATFLFILGVLFGYYVVVPLAMNFLPNYPITGDIATPIPVHTHLPSLPTPPLASPPPLAHPPTTSLPPPPPTTPP